MSQRRLRPAARFRASESGNVAVVFAAVMIPVVAIVAAALDYGRASQRREQLQKATDAAIEVASRHLHLDRVALQALVRTNLDANLKEELRQVPFTMTVPSDKSSVEIAIETSVPTSLLAIAGIPRIEVAATAIATRVEPAPPSAQAPAAPAEASDALMDEKRQLGHPAFGRRPPRAHAPLPGEAAAARALGEILAAGTTRQPLNEPVQGHQDLRQATERLSEQLRDIERQLGQGAAGDLERYMRELRRQR